MVGLITSLLTPITNPSRQLYTRLSRSSSCQLMSWATSLPELKRNTCGRPNNWALTALRYDLMTTFLNILSFYIILFVHTEHRYMCIVFLFQWCKLLYVHTNNVRDIFVQVLLNTIVYFNTKYFLLKSADMHRRLSFPNVVKHWKRTLPNPAALQHAGGIPSNLEKKTILLRYYPPVNSKAPRGIYFYCLKYVRILIKETRY